MRFGIEDQVGQHLAVRSGIAVHGKVRLAIDREGNALASLAGLQASDDLLRYLAEIETPPVRQFAIGSDLLERLDQVHRVIEIAQYLSTGLTTYRKIFG